MKSATSSSPAHQWRLCCLLSDFHLENILRLISIFRHFHAGSNRSQLSKLAEVHKSSKMSTHHCNESWPILEVTYFFPKTRDSKFRSPSWTWPSKDLFSFNIRLDFFFIILSRCCDFLKESKNYQSKSILVESSLHKKVLNEKWLYCRPAMTRWHICLHRWVWMEIPTKTIPRFYRSISGRVCEFDIT